MGKIERLIENQIEKDLQKKIVILAGPRQCGKTTLAKVISKRYDYLNFDSLDDRAQILKRQWDRNQDLIILDELHKMPKWKSWLKGIYDKEGVRPRLLVTGSARLDAFKKTGDSLAGRHYYYRLHPFDLKELCLNKKNLNIENAFETLLSVGGFPEPFINGSVNEYKRWRKGHLDLILKQDLADFQTVRDLQSIQILIELLRERVGSGISVNSLAIDLNKDPKTVQRWLDIIEDLFIIFKLSPYSKDISRSLKKEPKYYFYDTGLVNGDNSAKLENLVACALLKETHRLMDAEGVETRLHYLKVKGGREIDFLVLPDDRKMPASMIEVKWSESDASPNFKLFESNFKSANKIQLVRTLEKNFTTSTNIHVCNAVQWLSKFSLL